MVSSAKQKLESQIHPAANVFKHRTASESKHHTELPKPSEPKLSQLSSEEEEEVSMGTAAVFLKLRRFILVDGGNCL